MTLEERFDALLGMPESTSSGKTLFWQVTEDDAADLLALLEAAKAEGIREGMERAAKVVLEYSPGRAWDWETSLDIREGLSVLAEAIRAAAKAGKEGG